MHANVSTKLPDDLGREYGTTTTAVLGWALQSSFRHLEDCIRRMETVTYGPLPDKAVLTAARYRIGQASFAKRQLVHRSCRHLLDLVTPAEATTLRSLQLQDFAYVRVSTEHIRTWSLQAIEQDWPGYRDASRRIRALMRQVVRGEQRQLLPLLSLYEHH